MITKIYKFIFSYQFCSKLMIGAIGWFLRTLALKDAQSITKCLELTHDLKNLLEEINKKVFQYSRDLSFDAKKIFELKRLLDKIELEKNGLTFPCHPLSQLTLQTLNIIRNKKEAEKSYTILDIFEIWGYSAEKDEFTQISEILTFLTAWLPKRFWLWSMLYFKNWYKRLSTKYNSL